MITYTSIGLKDYVDASVSPEESIVLRYCKSFSPKIDIQLLESVSIREGCLIVGPVEYCGVNIFVLDMASYMADGNFKSSVACTSIARCLEQGAHGLVTCSSGNTASAVARYTKEHNLKTHIFMPKTSAYKFDFSLLKEGIHEVEILDKPEWEINSAAREFARSNSLPFVPSNEHQLEANSCRTLFVLEYMLETGTSFHWVSQAVSGGHGPAGFYKKLYSLMKEGLELDSVPGFIGVQQAGVCPMYNAWSNGRSHLAEEDINPYLGNVLEPTLYSTRPEINYRYLHGVISDNGGAFYRIDRSEYQRLEEDILCIILELGIKLKIKKIDKQPAIMEKAGILSGMGVLKAIEDQIIKPGENVLLTFTGTTELLPSESGRLISR